MAQGKGKIKGWFTRNGVHIPIYEEYTVRKGPEPENVKGKFKGNTKNTKKDATSDLRKSIETDIKSKMENYWKNSEYKDSFVKSDVEDTMGRVDRMLDHLKGKNLIEPGDNKDIPNEIKWKFAGRDKATGKRASFEFSSSANVQKAKETLRGNGYTVSTGKIFPVNIYNALADRTNMDSYDVRAAEALTKAALSEWKKRNKK